jgi:hypothetical protein
MSISRPASRGGPLKSSTSSAFQKGKVFTSLPPDVHNPELFGGHQSDFLLDEEFPDLAAERSLVFSEEDQVDYQSSFAAENIPEEDHVEPSVVMLKTVPKKALKTWEQKGEVTKSLKTTILTHLNQGTGTRTSTPSHHGGILSPNVPETVPANTSMRHDRRQSKEASESLSKAPADVPNLTAEMARAALTEQHMHQTRSLRKNASTGMLSPRTHAPSQSSHLTNSRIPSPATSSMKLSPSTVGFKFSVDQVDDFIRVHRQQIRDITDCCKDETKLLTRLTMHGFPSQSSSLHEEDAVASQDSLRDSNMSEAFTEYVFNLDKLLERKFRAMVELRQRIKGLMVTTKNSSPTE